MNKHLEKPVWNSISQHVWICLCASSCSSPSVILITIMLHLYPVSSTPTCVFIPASTSLLCLPVLYSGLQHSSFVPVFMFCIMLLLWIGLWIWFCLSIWICLLFQTDHMATKIIKVLKNWICLFLWHKVVFFYFTWIVN